MLQTHADKVVASGYITK